jgi:hypothetical protein
VPYYVTVIFPSTVNLKTSPVGTAVFVFVPGLTETLGDIDAGTKIKATPDPPAPANCCPGDAL